MTAVQRRAVAATLLSAMTLAGCGGSTDSSTAPPPSPPTRSGPTATVPPTPQVSTTTASEPPSPAPTQEPDPAAKRALRAALVELIAADSGSVQSVMVLGPGRTTTDAQYRVSTRSMSMHETISYPTEDPLAVDAIGIDQDEWFRIAQGGAEPKRTCWMHSTIEGIESAVGVDLPSGSRGVPAGLVIASNATAISQPDPTHLVAAIDLYSAAGAFSGKFPITLGIDYRTKATAPVTFTLHDGSLTGWRITFEDLLQSIEEAGIELPDEFAGFEQVDLGDSGVSVTFKEPGRDVTVEEPAAGVTVELTGNQEQFAADRKACDAKLN